MRRLFIWLSLVVCSFAVVVPGLQAATGKVIKVLPHFLDLQGRNTVSPSLYDRDAYQFYLRQHPEKRSGIRFDVQWKAKGPFWSAITLRIELRGTVQGNLPKEMTLEEPVEPGGWFSNWTGLLLGGKQYKEFGEVTAWRATLWEGDQMIGEQKSFLW